MMGKMVEVEVYETGKHFMKAHMVGDVVSPGLKAPLPRGVVSGATTTTTDTHTQTPSTVVSCSSWHSYLHFGVLVVLFAIGLNFLRTFGPATQSPGPIKSPR